MFLLLTAGQLPGQTKTSVNDEKFNPLITGVCDRDFVDSSRSNWLGTGPRPIIILQGERGHYLTAGTGTERAVELCEVSCLAYGFFEEVLKK